MHILNSMHKRNIQYTNNITEIFHICFLHTMQLIETRDQYRSETYSYCIVKRNIHRQFKSSRIEIILA